MVVARGGERQKGRWWEWSRCYRRIGSKVPTQAQARTYVRIGWRGSCEPGSDARWFISGTPRCAFEEAGVNRRMHLGILVICFVPLLHNRLSRQLDQLSTPPTLFSLCSPFLPSSSALSLSLFLSFSFFLSVQLPLFSPVLPSVSFIPTPSLRSFLSFLTTSSVLSVASSLSFLSEPIPLCHLLLAVRSWALLKEARDANNYRNKSFHFLLDIHIWIYH